MNDEAQSIFMNYGLFTTLSVNINKSHMLAKHFGKQNSNITPHVGNTNSNT